MADEPDDTDRTRPGQAGETAKKPAEPAFDSRIESHWSTAMLVAWIAWRDFDLVSEQNPKLRSEHWHSYGLLDRERKPDEPEFPMGLSLEIRGARTISRLGQMDEAFRAQGNLPSTAVMTIREAVAELWRKWGDDLLTATGVNKEGEVGVIPSRELAYLELREEEGQDVLRYRHQRDIDDFVFMKPAFTEVRFPRIDLLRVWPPVAGELPATPATVAGESKRRVITSEEQARIEFQNWRKSRGGNIPSLAEDYTHMRQFGVSRDRVRALRRSKGVVNLPRGNPRSEPK
jgi:hypothetical protein